MPDELETCIQCGGTLVDKDVANASSTSEGDVEKKKEWLSEQSKIKDELQDLISRLGGDSESGGSASTETTTAVSKPTESLLEQSTKSLLGDRSSISAPKSEKDPELMKELEDLRTEGFNVSRLEKAIDENPGSAWKIFSQFLDDVDKIKGLRQRLDDLDTTGREIQIANIKSKLNNPDLASELETQITELEQSPPASGLGEDRAPVSFKSAEPEPAPKKEEHVKENKLDELIEAGKDAYRVDDFQSALKFFKAALKMDPDNKQVQFFKKKTVGKITEADQGIKSVSAELESISGEEAYESWDQELTAGPKKGKKKKKKKGKLKKKKAKVKGKKEVAESRSATELEALGFNAFINKDYQKALEFYKKVLEIDPNFPGVKARIDECQGKL
jgi:tetratricopeptide (TPR) repeat protein